MGYNKLIRIWSITACGLLALFAVSCFASILVTQGTSVNNCYIPYPVREKKSDFIQKGWSVWLQQGEEGYRKAAKETVALGGMELKSHVLYMTGVLKKPVEGVVIRGMSDKKHPVTVPKETYAHYVYNMEATAYDPSPESNGVEWAGETCLGWKTRRGIAAVDPKVISLRSLIFVEGYGFAWTGDVGGAIKGKRIDLCYNTTDEAFRWGRKKVKVYVLGSRPMVKKDSKE
jgi:3D (Asp-Asp-Asp) domain-containing protein